MWFIRKFIYWACIWPVTALLFGIKARNKERIPLKGPFIIVSNHSSNSDYLVLLAVTPGSVRHRCRPLAESDFCYRNNFSRRIADQLAQVIPIDGKSAEDNAYLAECENTLQTGGALYMFAGYPDISSSSEQVTDCLVKLATQHPDIPVIPVYIAGTDIRKERNESLLVPVSCDAFVGEPLSGFSDSETFAAALVAEMARLKQQLIQEETESVAADN